MCKCDTAKQTCHAQCCCCCKCHTPQPSPADYRPVWIVPYWEQVIPPPPWYVTATSTHTSYPVDIETPSV